jgi:hypothetical protein
VEVNPSDETKRAAKNVTGPDGAEVLGSVRTNNGGNSGGFNQDNRNRY